MKRLLPSLIVIFTFISLVSSCSKKETPNNSSSGIDSQILKTCMNATDFEGCVSVMSGNKKSGNPEKEKLIIEIKKLPSRLKNTSLRDFSLSTMDFTDTLALSTPEGVGSDFYEKAKKLEIAIDVLQNVWSRKVQVDAEPQCKQSLSACWKPEKNLEAKLILDDALNGNTIEIKCDQWGLWRVYKAEDIFFKVRDIVSEASIQLVNNGDFSFPSQEEPPYFASKYTKSCTEKE